MDSPRQTLKGRKRAFLRKVQAYLVTTVPGGQLLVFISSISIEDFRPEKLQRRNAHLHTLAAVVSFYSVLTSSALTMR
jgi:hypothetical protein